MSTTSADVKNILSGSEDSPNSKKRKLQAFMTETKIRSEKMHLVNCGNTQIGYEEINLYDFCGAHLTRQTLIESLQAFRENKELRYAIRKDLAAYCKVYCQEHPRFKTIAELRRTCLAHAEILMEDHYPEKELPDYTSMVSFLKFYKPLGYDIFLEKKKAYEQTAIAFIKSDEIFDQYVESLNTTMPGLNTILVIAEKMDFSCQFWHSSTKGFICAAKTIPAKKTPPKLEINILILDDLNFKILNNKGPHKPEISDDKKRMLKR